MTISVSQLQQLRDPVKEEAAAAAWRTLMSLSNPAARVALAWLADYCNVFACSHERGDPQAVYVNEGRRDAFNAILEKVTSKPAAVEGP